MTVLAIDLGGTNMRAGLAQGDSIEPAPAGRWSAPAGMKSFRERVAALVAEHGIKELGICIPGLAHGTVCTWVPNLPFLNGADLAAVFPDVRVTVGNDAQFSLLAEAAGGAARNTRNAILLAMGTGIGSAVLADGGILRGEGGAAASFGWACADPSDQGDSHHGWLERTASGTALDQIAMGMDIADGVSLVGLAREGNARACEALAPPMNALGTALAGAVALTGSQLVLFAGGVADGLDILGPLLRPALVRQLPPHLRGVQLVPGAFGARAALVGAGLAARGHPIWLEERS